MQGIRTVQRLSSAANLVGRVSVSGVRWNSSSNIAGGSMGRAWADKEHAAEAQYFNKKDAELLSNLANKLHNHTAVCSYQN